MRSIWAILEHVLNDAPLQNGIPARDGMGNRVRDHAYPWTMCIILKEIILNGQLGSGRKLASWKELASVVNGIRDLEGVLARRSPKQDIYLHLHRIGHQQFHWQERGRMGRLMRNLYIYEHSTLTAVFENHLGISFQEYIFLGLAISGGLLKSPNVLLTQGYSAFGVSDNTRDKFFQLTTIDFGELKARTEKVQLYDERWPDTLNPLQSTPFVVLDSNSPSHAICPVSAYLMERVTTGVFFDIVNAPRFNDAFGKAFDSYIGRVMVKAVPKLRPIKPEPYALAKGKVNDGVDWILEDATASLFVECKTKRMTHGAKMAQRIEDLDADLEVLAKAISQNYSNIQHAISGKTAWVNRSLDVFNLVVTLEDWVLFGPLTQKSLSEKIARRNAEKGLSEDFVSTVPSIVLSAAEFETLCCSFRTNSITSVLKKKCAGEESKWMMMPFLQQEYPDAVKDSRFLFAEEFVDLGKRYDPQSVLPWIGGYSPVRAR